MIDINYNTLFSVELLHKYSKDKSCNDFTVVPSGATKQLLSNHRIIVKQYNNTLSAYVLLDSSAKPFIIPENGLQLTFFMALNNPLFFNYTSVPAVNNKGNIYYFTNRGNNRNSVTNKNFLTTALQDYNSGTTYSYEDIVIDVAGTGKTYQSVNNSNTGNVLTDTSNWRDLGSDRFMSGADQLSWMPSVSSLAPATATNVTVKDSKGNLVLTRTVNPSFPLDISGLVPGKYFLTIGANPEISIYLNDELGGTKVFGVIDIFIENTLAPDYLILKQDANPAKNNTLNSPLYSIFFLNRATIWKYVLNQNSKGQISVAGYNFPTADANPIFSSFPIPLNEAPLTVGLSYNTTKNGVTSPTAAASSVACASPERIIKYQPNPPLGNVYNCSEIFLDY